MLRFTPSLSRRYFAPSCYVKHVSSLVDLTYLVGAKKYPITIRLREEEVPETAYNFWALCGGKEGNSLLDAKVERAISGLLLQTIPKDCSTVFGKRMLNEAYGVETAKKGQVVMLNDGPHHNSSAFTIILKDGVHIGKAVIVGEVEEGIEGLLEISALGNSEGSLKDNVTISKCNVHPRK